MLCAIHANQSIAKKMKADPDEMTENPDEGLQVPKNYLEVFTDGPATKPEVSAPTQAEMEKFYFTTAVEKFLIYIVRQNVFIPRDLVKVAQKALRIVVLIAPSDNVSNRWLEHP